MVRANSPQNFFSVVLKSRQYQQIQSTNPNTGIVTFENVPYDNYEVVVRDISSGKVIKEGVGVALDAEYRRVAIPLEAVPEKQPEPKTEEGRLEIRVTREGATDALNTYIVMLVSENRKKIINHTDSFGQVSFSDLPLGTYQITVLEPGSHEILKDDIQVTLTKLFPERVIQISLSAPAEKPVEEVDPASIPKGTFDGRIVCSVDDASCPTCTEKIYRLELVNSETKKRYYRWTNHGTFRFEDLPYGDYTLQVYSSPMEQVCCDKPIAVRISELFPNPTRVIKDLNNACCPQPATTRDDNGNKPKFGSVFISVKGKGDAKPPFEVALLSRSNTQNFRYKQPTNKYGDVFFDNVGFDVYYVYIYEGTLPDGRLLSSDYTLTVSELDPHIRKTYEVGAEKKAPKTGTLQLTVTCPDGSYKAPFKITLRGASNPASQIYTKVTDDDGRVFFEKLSIDRYRVEAYADPFTDKFIQGEHQIEISELSLNKIMTLAICGEKKKKDVGDLEVTVKSRNAGKCAAPFYIRLVNLRNSHTVDNIKASSSAPGSVRLDGDVLSGGSAFRMTFTNLEKSVYRVEVYADESRLKLLDKSINVAVDAVRTEVEVEVCDKPVKKGGEIAGKIQKPCRDTEIYIVDLIKDNKLVASDTTGNSDNFKFRFPNLEFGNYCLRVYLAIDDPYRYVEKFECIDVTLSELLPVAWRDVKIDCPSQQTKGSLMVMIEDCQNIGEYRVVITNQSTKKVKTSDASDNRSSSPRRANLKFEGLDLGVYAVTLYSNNVEQANVSKLLGDSVTVALTETFPHQAVRFNTCEKPKPEDPRRIVLRINLEDKPELKPEKYRVELTDGENPPFEYQSIKFTDDKGEVVFSNLNLTTYRLFVYDTFGNRILSGEDCLEVTLSNRSPSWLIEITLRPDNAAEARSSRSRYERSYGGNRTTTNSDTPSRCQKLPLYP
ncbi:MAG: hypothetical protein D6675_11415 [Gemmatimonadetes bacterium]|nr:MAG: hypothetical protein D6675_11415 [Gemmatimonadota bacterium]